ncbi:MAG: HEAT repeat domain-containing protein [Planctomycetota bacterium]|nr:HEAT repeat domain-containing protein [Planctomycetota bacterium]
MRKFLLALPLSFSMLAAPAQSQNQQFTFFPDELVTEFDFGAPLSWKSDDAAIEVALNWQSDEDYYLIKIGKTASLTKIHKGLTLPLVESGNEAVTAPTERTLYIKRRKDSIRIYLNDALILQAVDDAFTGGKLGLRTVAGDVGMGRHKYQPVAPIVFSDDFMRSSQNEVWTTNSGEWELQGSTNASMSSNAFYFIGRAPDGKGSAVTGERFWDSYQVECAIRMTDAQGGGLIACQQNANSYYLLKWSGEKIGRLHLIRMTEGKETALASCLLPYHLGHWYRLDFSVVDGELVASVDGHEVLSATDRTLYQGKAGLFSASPAGVHFDDVQVFSMASVRERFDDEVTGRWTLYGGTWQRGISTFGGVFPGDACLRVDADDPAKAILARDVPADFIFEADTFAPEGVFGLCFYYRDEVNYWLARVTPKGASLIEKREGQLFVHDKIETEYPPALRRIRITTEKHVVRVTIDGQEMQAVVEEAQGRVGFYAANANQTAFDNAYLMSAEPLTPVFIQHEVFGGERTMAGWSVARSDWDASDFEGMSGQWHRGAFPGDVSMRIQLNRRPARRSVMRLKLGGSRTDASMGCSLELDFANTASIAIKRGGKTLAEKQDVPLTFPFTVRFSQLGHFAVVHIGQQAALHSKLPEDVHGREIGWAADGFEVAAEDVFVEARNCNVYTFKTATVDWIAANGDWQVTNRWTCDPRWSFFSGVSDNLAVLWNKRPLRGNAVVEFAAGPKMNPNLGGSDYTRYAHDINVTLCADGKDLTTGYSLIYGGWKNSHSRILRNNRIVAETNNVIPTSGLHRRWLYFRAEKKGDEISLTVEGEKILSFIDPAPLPGNRVALWTYDNGVMVARVRMAADEIGRPSFPSYPPPTWGTCIYNHPAQPDKVADALKRIQEQDLTIVGNAAYELSQLREPSTIPNLTPLLQSQDDNVRWQAASALAAIGLPGVQALLKELDTDSDQARWKIESALRQAGAEAAPLIVNTLLNGTDIQRRSCAYILRDIPADETCAGLVAAMADKDSGVQWKAADSLFNLGQIAAPIVVRALRNKSTQIRQTAAWVLGKMPVHAPIEALIGALGDPDNDVRWKAATAIKEREPRPETDVVSAYKFADRMTREHLVWILTEWKYGGLTELRKSSQPDNAQQSQAKVRGVKIESTPVGASVFINDKYAGISPGTFTAPAAESVVTLHRHGYSPWSGKIAAEKTDSLRVEFEPLSRLELTVLSMPSAASVFLDNEFRGNTPITLQDVTSGTHQLRLEREGCFTIGQDLKLLPNKNQSIRLSLKFKSEQFYLDRLKDKPDMASFRTELAHLYFLMNDFDKGRDQFLEAFRLVKTGRDQSGYASRLTQELGKIQTAFFDYGDEQSQNKGRAALEQVYEQLTKEFPADSSFWTSLAQLQMGRGAYQQIVDNMTQALRHLPNDWEIHFALGIAQYSLASNGQATFKSQAEASLNKARQLAPAKQQSSVDQYLQNLLKLP